MGYYVAPFQGLQGRSTIHNLNILNAILAVLDRSKTSFLLPTQSLTFFPIT